MVYALLAAIIVIPLSIITFMGQRKRGGGIFIAATSAIFFPVTWVAWYIADGMPGLAEKRSSRGVRRIHSE